MNAKQSAQLSWNPGLDNAAATLEEVRRSMPGDGPDHVPWYVTALENPKSPIALAGAVDLFAHDCIHVLLGRGLTQRDEAFVLGFTMGTSRRRSRHARGLFRFCARFLYRGVWRFSEIDGRVFDFAFQAGERTTPVALDRIDYRAFAAWPLGRLRRTLGLNPAALRTLYATERKRWPLAAPRPRLVESQRPAER